MKRLKEVNMLVNPNATPLGKRDCEFDLKPLLNQTPESHIRFVSYYHTYELSPLWFTFNIDMHMC